MYTVEVYRRDRRVKTGERLVKKVDHSTQDRASLEQVYKSTYPGPGFRYEIHETYVTRKNIMNGAEFQERYDTPYYCSPRSESFWSM
jgi:hypothetical protein